jgi:putative Mn2+ efflux pump MntP
MDQLPVGLLSIFTVALLHTLIPSHWLCFVVVGRAQGWKTRKTLAVTAAAGLLHVATTIILGVAFGTLAQALIAGEGTLERLSAFCLVGLGCLYLASHLFRAGHHHEQDAAVREKAAIAALLFSLVVSPCTVAIPLLVAAQGSLGQIASVAAILLATTVGGMMLLVGLTSLGIEKLQFQAFDRYEKLIVGLVLCALGALVLLVH